MDKFLERLLGAARLDADTYEQVEADQSALGQAAAVVVLSSIAGGIGSGHTIGLSGLVVATIVQLLAWGSGAIVIYVIGAKIAPEPQTESDVGELLRTLGFATAPGLIRIAGVVPVLFVPVFALAGIWTLAATVVAVRQALDYTSTLRAVAVCIAGAIVQGLIAAAFLRPLVVI